MFKSAKAFFLSGRSSAEEFTTPDPEFFPGTASHILPDHSLTLKKNGASNLPPHPKKIVAVGHRGTKIFAPENTIIAHETAYEMGARAIEFDVRCTKDGHFVVIHDATVNRTTDGRGFVSQMTLSELKKLDAGCRKGPHFCGETIPTLREALRNVRGRYVVDIDFKGGPKNSAELLARILQDEWSDKDPLVTIFARRHHFKTLKALSADYALRPHYISHARTRFVTENFPLEIMGLRRLSFSQRAAQVIRSHNLHLFCNVMGRHDNKRGFSDSVEAGALFIQTDHLHRLVPFLKHHDLLQHRVLGHNYHPMTDENPSLATALVH